MIFVGVVVEKNTKNVIGQIDFYIDNFLKVVL